LLSLATAATPLCGGDPPASQPSPAFGDAWTRSVKAPMDAAKVTHDIAVIPIRRTSPPSLLGAIHLSRVFDGLGQSSCSSTIDGLEERVVDESVRGTYR